MTWVTSRSPPPPTGPRPTGPPCMLGVGLRHDLDDAVALDRGEALQPQRRQQRRVDEALGHRPRRHDVDRALDLRVEDEVAAGDLGDRLDDRLDVGVDEIQRDRVGVLRDADRQRRGDGQSGETARQTSGCEDGSSAPAGARRWQGGGATVLRGRRRSRRSRKRASPRVGKSSVDDSMGSRVEPPRDAMSADRCCGGATAESGTAGPAHPNGYETLREIP